MKKPLILVTGATGFVGREAVAQWVDAVKAGKMFFPPTVKGRPGHSVDDYLRANAATLNT